MVPPPLVVKILMLVGQLVLAGIYGLLGTILTALLYLRLGREKFFRRGQRPSPPPQATDPAYGKHDMIKLKVPLHWRSQLMYIDFELISSRLTSLCTTYRKVCQVNRWCSSSMGFRNAGTHGDIKWNTSRTNTGRNRLKSQYRTSVDSFDTSVVAIDQRGYGLSSKPAQVKDYAVETLARDIADVIEQLGHKNCVLVGHDWGGIVSWVTAIL